MQIDNQNNIIVKLLVLPRFRIVRHLLLIICILSIFVGNIGQAIGQGIVLSPVVKYMGLFCSTGVALAACYINIYILTPRLLLKNKWGWYFVYLLGLAILLLIIVLWLAISTGIASISIDDGAHIDSFTIFRGTINLLSSILAFFVLLAGTSTLILFKKWIMDMEQSEALESATLQMELKLLENQINPHFLFNMLNNANIMIRKDTDIAIHIISKLEEMLRYLMHEDIQGKTSLKDEIRFLNDFLELENIRKDYFEYSISQEENVDNIQLAPLLFITFVENAVKHSQDSKATSYVHILFKTEKDKLIFICENSIPRKTSDDKVGGIGLVNINRRLDLLYEGCYSLQQSRTETNYTVKLELKL